MWKLLQDSAGETTAPLLFLVLFLLIVGLALYLTPRIAHWLERKDRNSPGYFDTMLDSPPEAPAPRDEKEDPGSK